MTDQPPSPPPPPGFGPPPPSYAPQHPPHPPQYAQPYVPQAVPPPGPEFLAVDKHNSVVVDAAGVAFEMYDITVEFPWPEVRSVHYKASPSGKALMVAVVHVDGRVYECVVTAKPRERLQGWFAQLAWVLGHYRPTGY
ncbi:hypothetical protein [Streptomyces sp. Root1310]|uniref:hypothetical protein n=1 Tax=Streptomyces sp. Root1310 TaxID=1736452 RepID=UPI00070B0266|nr:hypothetical protein [Streptomyces sp. Root1310]KQX71196.1 hypothetical protein ASD48_12415 [Streptomyces sp. Root1310]